MYLKEVAQLAGIKKYLTTHTARHTFATTILLDNDVPLETVSKLLGHSSVRSTQIYAKTAFILLVYLLVAGKVENAIGFVLSWFG